MLIKDLKGQEAFRERSVTELGWNCGAPWENSEGNNLLELRQRDFKATGDGVRHV